MEYEIARLDIFFPRRMCRMQSNVDILRKKYQHIRMDKSLITVDKVIRLDLEANEYRKWQKNIPPVNCVTICA